MRLVPLGGRLEFRARGWRERRRLHFECKRSRVSDLTCSQGMAFAVPASSSLTLRSSSAAHAAVQLASSGPSTLSRISVASASRSPAGSLSAPCRRSERLAFGMCQSYPEGRRPTSRCSRQSRRRDIGVESCGRLSGGLAAERQSVRRAGNHAAKAILGQDDLCAADRSAVGRCYWFRWGNSRILACHTVLWMGYGWRLRLPALRLRAIGRPHPWTMSRVAVVAQGIPLLRRPSRVGDRRGGVQDDPWLCPPFPASCPFRGSITPSPAPATSNRTGGFPASGSPRRRLPSGLCVRSVGACFRAPVHHAVVSKEAPRSVHNGATPPLPAESLALALLGR